MNAICGDGSRYNKMDHTTNKGMNPDDVASLIYQGVLSQKDTLVIAPLYMRATVVLQTLCPNVIASIMARKAKKEQVNLLFDC